MDHAPERRAWYLGGAVLLILAQIAFRAWALYPSWFYTDDYRLLYDATTSQLDLAYLGRPFDSQFMPLGRMVAWWVAHSGSLNWGLAATLTVLTQAAASAACCWMLFTLFGRSRRALLLLVLYLTSAMVLPSSMWWAAALNQLPWQLVFFLAVTAWVRHLDTGQARWSILLVLVLVLGVLAYVKAVLIVGVLAYLLLAYYVDGGPANRLRDAVRRHWGDAAVVGTTTAVFLAYYLTQVPHMFGGGSRTSTAGLAENMLGTSLVTGLVGGPWHWNRDNPPIGYADPPALAVHAAWALLTVALLVLALRRRGTGRAWSLLAGYVAVDFFLVLTSPGRVVGDLIGLQYRYLADVVPVFILCLGLAVCPLRGAVSSSEPRPRPRLLLSPGAVGESSVVALIAAGAVVSSIGYVAIWHQDNPGDAYVDAARASLRGRGPVDLADQVVPPSVVPGFSSPYNTTRRLLALAAPGTRFPAWTDRLVVLDDGGTARRALIDTATTSPAGPDGACGWKVRRGARSIPLRTTTYDDVWWVRLGYIADRDGTVRVSAGRSVLDARVRRGLHSLYVRVVGPLSSVDIEPTDGATLCVDVAEVGRPVPGGEL